MKTGFIYTIIGLTLLTCALTIFEANPVSKYLCLSGCITLIAADILNAVKENRLTEREN